MCKRDWLMIHHISMKFFFSMMWVRKGKKGYVTKDLKYQRRLGCIYCLSIYTSKYDFALLCFAWGGVGWARAQLCPLHPPLPPCQ